MSWRLASSRGGLDWETVSRGGFRVAMLVAEAKGRGGPRQAAGVWRILLSRGDFNILNMVAEAACRVGSLQVAEACSG